MKKRTYLTNPPRTRRARPGRAAPRRKKRSPPKGFATWAAYMASIRPRTKTHARNPAKKRTTARRARATAKGEGMARKRGKRRHASNPLRSRRHSTTHRASAHRRRTYRRNPPGLGRALKSIPHTAIAAGIGAVTIVAAKVAVRKVRGSIFKQAPGTLFGSLIEGGAAIAGGILLGMWHPGLGEDFAKGGLAAPLETAVQNMGIPHVSDSLGDDGYVVGPGTGVTLVSAFPDDYAGVASGNGSDNMGRYVSGVMPSSQGQMGAYVAGNIGVA